MTAMHRKRKFAGPRPQERRQEYRDPAHIPPHKKERKFRLIVRWSETTEYSGTEVYTTRAARDEAKRRITQEIGRSRNTRQRYWDFGYFDRKQYMKGLVFEKVRKVAVPPAYEETEDE